VLFCIFPSLIGDLVPKDQQGTANGWMVFFENLGAILGCIIGIFSEQIGKWIGYTVSNSYFFWIYAIVFLLMVIVLITSIVFIKEESSITENNSIEEKKKSNFTKNVKKLLKSKHYIFICIISSLSLGFIQSILQDYFQYYVVDNVKLPLKLFFIFDIVNSEVASSYFIIANFIGGLSAMIIGKLVDKQECSGLLIIGFVLQIPLPLSLLFLKTFDYIIIVTLLYGIAASTIRTFAMGYLQIILGKIDEKLIGLGNGLFIVLSFAIPVMLTLLYGYIIDFYSKKK